MSVDVDTSMLALLLKLHAKMAGKQNSYIPVGVRGGQQGDEPLTDSRIGDGCFFVGRCDSFQLPGTLNLHGS